MDTKKITRFEVIDYRKNETEGRVFVAWNVKAEIQVQDEGETLKIFIDDRNKKDKNEKIKEDEIIWIDYYTIKIDYEDGELEVYYSDREDIKIVLGVYCLTNLYDNKELKGLPTKMFLSIDKVIDLVIQPVCKK